MRDGRYEAAYHVTRSVSINNNRSQVKHNLGHCLAEMNHIERARDMFLESISDEPSAEGWSSLASCYAKLGRFLDAVNAADEALKIKPEHNDAKWNASLAMLALRRWKRGWEWWDAALGTRMRPFPKWLGTDLPTWGLEQDAVLLITGEQGLGDEIMFASMLPDVIKVLGDPGRVYLAPEHRLCGLFRRSFPGIHVAARDKVTGYKLEPGMPTPTHHIAMGSLGRLFRNLDTTFPGSPYLTADPARVIMWEALLSTLGPGKKVGINWEGGVDSTGYARRSFQAIDWMHAWKTGIVFVNLNHKDANGDAARLMQEVSGIAVHSFPFVHSDDYDDTAALVAALDEVATVTTTVAHLAGALGKPVHVYVPPQPQWRYGLAGRNCLWYKSMRLYRQTKTYQPGYGFMPFNEIRDAL